MDPIANIKFMDESEESSREIIIDHDIPKLVNCNRLISYMFANVRHYSFQPWHCYQNIKLQSLLLNTDWYEFFTIVQQKSYFNHIEASLARAAKDQVVPYPELVFNAMNIISPSEIRVVIIGQDPYIGIEEVNGRDIPQAMGYSFSIPVGLPLTPSLRNIYENLKIFGHIIRTPTSGCLAGWLLQGCLLMNAALTTVVGKSNAHKDIWQEFTGDLIKYINDKCDKLVFVAWGSDAHKLLLEIDTKRHTIITSSHPSPYSYMKSFTGYEYGKNKKRVVYPAFRDVDHFGLVNQHLGQDRIMWDVINADLI